MAVTNPLFNDEKLAVLKKNIEEVSKKDNHEDFRVDVVEYINDSSYEASDEFFFDYLVGLRFLEPGNDAIAYTVPDGRIYMNCPNDKINGIREWEFIYDHECLHQLWETFDVQHEIERDFGSCDYELLNIASDCVINDYLAYYRKKKMPSVGINPKNLEEHYGVV